MSSLKQIRDKIGSIQNIQKITKALEIISTIKLQKTKEQAQLLKQYLVDIMFILNSISWKVDYLKDQKIEKRKRLVVFVSTEKGLCGALNSKLFRKFYWEFSDKKEDCDVFVVWSKWLGPLSRWEFNIVGNVELKDDFTHEDLLPLFEFLEESIETSSYSDIYVYFNYFKSSLNQIPTKLQIFPLKKKNFENFISEVKTKNYINDDFWNKDFLIDVDIQTLVKEVKRQIRNYMLTSLIVQNKTWEHASRMIAMKSAKDNSFSMVKDLTLEFNKIRQANITNEISEIVWAKIAIEW